MPQIPYQAFPEVEPSGQGAPMEQVGTPGEAFGSGLAQAAEKAGQTAKEFGQQQYDTALKFQQLQNETDANEAGNNFAQFTADQESDFRKLQGQDAMAALPALKERLQQQIDSTAQSMRSPMARQAFLRDSRSFFDRALYGAGIYAGDELKRANALSYNGKIASLQNSAALHFDDPGIVDTSIPGLVDATLSRAHNDGITDPGAVNAQVSENVGQMVHNVIAAQLAQGTTLAEQRASFDKAQALLQQYGKATIPGSPDVPMLNAKYQDSLSQMIQSRGYTLGIREEADLRRQEAANNRAAAHIRVGLSRDYTNAAAMVEQGFAADNFPSDDEVRAAYPNDPDTAAAMIERWGDLKQISSYLGPLAQMTPEQVSKLKAQLAPDPDQPDTFASRTRISNALDAALNKRAQALQKDPVQYLMQTHPDLIGLFQTGQKDALAMRMYAQHMEAAQATIGVPEAQRHILPLGVAGNIATQISADPMTAPQKLQQLQNQYGDLYPQIWHDLTTLGKLPPEYQVIGGLYNPQRDPARSRDAEYLARALQAGKDGKDMTKLVGEKEAATLKSAVEQNPVLRNYLRSLDASGYSDQQITGIRNATVLLALAKEFYGGERNTAPGAVNSIVNRYDFMGLARVPHEQSAAVRANASAMLRAVDPTKISVPSVFGSSPGGPSQRDYIDALRSNPNWITSPRGDALWLMDNGGRIVNGRDGQPLSVPFDAPRGAPPVFAATPAPAITPATGPVAGALTPHPFNLGNVKTASGSYAAPATPLAGAKLAADNLRRGYHGLTLQQIAAKWVGTNQKDEADWVSNVSRSAEIAPYEVPDLNDPKVLGKLLHGISVAEKSPKDRAHFTPDIIRAAAESSVAGH